ncbi:preprotein translocase subunit YajC [Xanthomarina sp. GH4-25]|uniref:preprotein translocase subunit YajC n=1 Tax=Xanthomarina sp. GH4-25 TaxID=3349335 RepID=UPI000D67420B|nr:preprotein translocase subunit YajC [Flavobacteriaceae bacterium LYZ1037]
MGEGISSFLPFILMFVVVYFFMIAPQMKRQKQEKKFAAELKRGDKVITKSGMHGKVIELNDTDASCVIETLAGKIKFDKSAISMEMSKKLNPSTTTKK